MERDNEDPSVWKNKEDIYNMMLINLQGNIQVYMMLRHKYIIYNTNSLYIKIIYILQIYINIIYILQIVHITSLN